MSQRKGKLLRNGGSISADAHTPPSNASSSPFPSVSPSPESTATPPDASSSARVEPGGPAAHTPTTPSPGSQSGSEPSNFPSAGDGLTDRLFRSKSKTPIAAIFIHAGAGFHSTANEHVHLAACSEAARIAMKFLKAGGSAVDAVEVAIKSLEDKEITNAGYGSNLTIDGVVEGDATIVDHLGRSGACGAAQMIKNPISLARLILDQTNVPLSLRRIPPNILVGTGARRFAEEHGMRLVPNKYLVSKGAHARFYRWRQELYRAETMTINASRTANSVSTAAVPAAQSSSGAKQPEQPPTKIARDQSPVGESTVAQEKQSGPDTQPGSEAVQEPAQPEKTDTASSSSAADTAFWPPRTATPHPKRLKVDRRRSGSQDGTTRRRKASRSSGDGPGMDKPPSHTFVGEAPDDEDADVITDTVGAIAVDFLGNIAAGSSSGGIGMKHSGRIGPAALVGIGTAVVPANPEDDNGTSVAAVTSGTGEHMATTMASHTCAERLYYNMRRDTGGSHVTEYDEDTIMKSFVLDDFMNHPGVRNQVSGGAIGVMAVKKTRKGVYFYFAHNTDSFALASLSSNEPDPLVVMSRLGPRENVARGGRKIKTG